MRVKTPEILSKNNSVHSHCQHLCGTVHLRQKVSYHELLAPLVAFNEQQVVSVKPLERNGPADTSIFPCAQRWKNLLAVFRPGLQDLLQNLSVDVRFFELAA